ncbi:SPFH domain-containing protein [Hyalangium versicolor]|uniref:SPFH domain-containing protein n=1 Tax=Hyalangium versicolor TaxID=2861190 RepID=UPI001CCD411F|nr:SPFH domain-containing protein [Hyalangium versicolor]
MDPLELFLQGFLGGVPLGVLVYLALRYGLGGLFTVDQNERAVKVRLGRAERLGTDLTNRTGPVSEGLARTDEDRYIYPQLRVYSSGGPYFKWPWEQVRKVSVATQTLNMAFDPDEPSANQDGTVIEAVTKDQLNTGLTGQLRYRVSENNLYAFLFGVKRPISHVMGFFVSILRQRISNFEAPASVQDPSLSRVEASIVAGISINDLRKNLRDLNEHMDHECKGSEARYGVVLEASLITGIDPPQDVESALAAINTAHNHVSSDISLAQAAADQKIVQSRRAVEIETLRAQAEVEPLLALSTQLSLLKRSGPGALQAYLRNIRLGLYQKAQSVFMAVKHD